MRINEARARVLVQGIWEGRAKAGAALNEDLISEANEKLDGLRGSGNERLALPLAWNSDSHRCSLS